MYWFITFIKSWFIIGLVILMSLNGCAYNPASSTWLTMEESPSTGRSSILYTVRRGDTLSEIAKRYDLFGYKEIARLNNILAPYTIYPDQVLQIPTVGNVYDGNRNSNVDIKARSINQQSLFNRQHPSTGDNYISQKKIYPRDPTVDIQPRPMSQRQLYSRGTFSSGDSKLDIRSRPIPQQPLRSQRTNSNEVPATDIQSRPVPQQPRYSQGDYPNKNLVVDIKPRPVPQQPSRPQRTNSNEVPATNTQLRPISKQQPTQKNRRYNKPSTASNTYPSIKKNYHIVQDGEALYGIAKRYGLAYRKLAAWNKLASPYTLEVGQRLRVAPAANQPVTKKRHATIIHERKSSKPSKNTPKKRSTTKRGSYHNVVQGDTIYTVASLYGCSLADLSVWNDLLPPYTLVPGQRLQVVSLTPKDKIVNQSPQTK